MNVIQAIENMTTIMEAMQEDRARQRKQLELLRFRMNCLAAALVVLAVIVMLRTS